MELLPLEALVLAATGRDDVVAVLGICAGWWPVMDGADGGLSIFGVGVGVGVGGVAVAGPTFGWTGDPSAGSGSVDIWCLDAASDSLEDDELRLMTAKVVTPAIVAAPIPRRAFPNAPPRRTAGLSIETPTDELIVVTRGASMLPGRSFAVGRELGCASAGTTGVGE